MRWHTERARFNMISTSIYLANNNDNWDTVRTFRQQPKITKRRMKGNISHQIPSISQDPITLNYIERLKYSIYHQQVFPQVNKIISAGSLNKGISEIVNMPQVSNTKYCLFHFYSPSFPHRNFSGSPFPPSFKVIQEFALFCCRYWAC